MPIGLRATASEGKNKQRAGLRRPALVLVLLVLLALLAAPGAVARPQAASAKKSTLRVVPSYEAQLARSINRVRRHYGLRCLKVVPKLRRSARIHSLQMARGGYFGHQALSGVSFTTRVRHFYTSRGFRYWSAGENLLWASASIKPWQVVARWLRSPGHRAVLLSSRWTTFGVGVVRSASRVGLGGGRPVLVVTVDFAVRRR
jgi:uncharacterized protein YkwD